MEYWVCENCIELDGLREFVRRNAVSAECSFCEGVDKSQLAADFDDVAKYMRDIIETYYVNPVHEQPYDSEVGGYHGDVFDVTELFARINLDISNDSLYDTLESYFGDNHWCQTDYFICSPSESRILAWKHFKDLVTHSRRYTFWSETSDGEDEDHPDHFPPGQMLAAIHEAIHHANVIQQVEPGLILCRARIHKATESLSTDRDFASPPHNKALNPNRMSPAGISMFYGSEDYETSFLEIAGYLVEPGTQVTGAQFRSMVAMNLLDLTAVRGAKSIFSVSAETYHELEFLRHFANDLSKPVSRDDSARLEYIPTQVFTEYVRYMLRTEADEPIHGIKYRSSINGKNCYVVFADHEQCLCSSLTPQLLQFVPNSVHIVAPPSRETVRRLKAYRKNFG